MDPIITLAEQIGAPIATTFKAKGQISDRHPLGCGVLGRSGTPIASWFMNECDLVVAFGASFSNHTGIAAYKSIVQIDFDPMALGRFHAVDVPVLGHVGVTADLLARALSGFEPAVDQRAEVAERWAIWREEKERRRLDDFDQGVNSAAVFDAMSRAVPDDAVLCVDVGNNAYSFGRYFEVSGEQDVLMSGYLGSIGFALPAAMGGVGRRRQRPTRRQHLGRRWIRSVRHGTDHRGQVRHEHHPRSPQQRRAGQDQQGATRRGSGRCGRRRSTILTSPPSPGCAGPSAPGSVRQTS